MKAKESLPLFQVDQQIPIIQTNWQDDAQIILHNGDVNDFIKTVPDESIQLIVTSPPYNVGKEYETQVSLNEYLITQQKLLHELYRILHPTGSICWQVGNYIQEKEVYPLDIYFYPFFKDLGMQLRNRIIWHFGHGLHAKLRLSGRYETLLWFTKTEDYLFNLDNIRVPAKYPGKRHYKGDKKGKLSGNPLGKNPSDVWEIVADDWETAFWEIPNCKSNHPEKTIHPAQYPIELVERCVLAFTKPNDRVFDPYAGVGSSLLGAIKNDRRAIGSELQSEYIDIANQRINSYFNGSLHYRRLGKPIHKPTGREKVAQVPHEWLVKDGE